MSDRLAEHHIRAYGLHAVYVASAGMPESSAVIVGRSRNLAASLRWLRGAHGPRVRIIRHWWCASERDAQRVVNASQGEAATALEMWAILPNIGAEDLRWPTAKSCMRPRSKRSRRFRTILLL
jgi:hypothetical protein